ncbi:hypothetical protein NP233_g3598 [Leucocoprinus birnbaumii]|uniref:MARVEL domain-containing protein n=1 Tax=Leucocoprinus birnbaumii TaxID=56174 RepID=A0AAD5VWW4_9AGAR|nr:hypothetical protein NP233_g3598 [Leucocoprinus birnbaumii]
MSSLLPLVRLVIFGIVSLFALIVMAMSAHILSLTHGVQGGSANFGGLGVAVGVLTLITLPPMIVIGRIRSGAMPTFIVVELGWIGFLWVLWLASAGTTASINGTGGNCASSNHLASTVCGEVNAIEAFGFLNWLMLMAYWLVLLVFSIRGLQSGNSNIWTTSVDEAHGSSNFAHDKSNVLHQPNYASQYPPMNATHHA